MHFAKVILMSMASLAIASPIEERAPTKPDNVNITIANLIDISQKIHVVNKTLNNLYPGAPNNTKTALLIESQSSDINVALNNATNYIRASRVWTSDESFAVADPLLSKLIPNTYSLLQKLASKNHTFKNNVKPLGDTRPRVLKALLAQEKAAGLLGNATKNHLDKSLRETAANINQDIHDHFETAIAAFSGP